MNSFTLLEQAARRFPNSPAIYDGDQLYATYNELYQRSLSLAAGLLSYANVGSRVVVASENRPELIEIYFAIWAAGMVVVPVNAKLHPLEIAHIIENADASIIFVSSKLAEAVASAVSNHTSVLSSPIAIGGNLYTSLAGTQPGSPVEASVSSLAWLFYTSGTTGRPKGAMLTHHNLISMSIAHLADIDDVDENSSIIHAAPMSHGSGLYILPYIARGARHVVPASSAYDVNEFLDLTDLHPRCGAFLAPTMVQRLRTEAERSNRRPRNLRNIIYGGGPMYVAELQKAIDWFGPIFSQIYGQGEAPMTITGMRRSDHCTTDTNTLGSVGTPRSGVDVRVIGPDGQDAGVGELGEIICRGDVVMSGYWKNPGATADTLRDGWLHTGDMGRLDARGFLTLLDRSKDVVISGGTNIYPREVEEVLLTNPNVLECCVLGRKDEEWGEVVVAFVVSKDHASISAADLDAHCLERIARFKRPKEYIFVESLPKNGSGKIVKRELRERLTKEPTASA
ncbi:AMP-binding protein [Paraburkholderia sp. LEh10]|uniref:AMP-binding protein n=1 Tax=Paraburkholderia sp. LEh10 TaxID=2821353 RepID=UPI001AEB6380|nr:AMP-binding protein [Paraburkholderia sp. LEh10]MBP0590453.1 AMP-binding protein [Paraburkholderia sp. LEh10]